MTETALKMTKRHPNWDKYAPFTIEQAASRAIQEQTVKDFRYLKALDAAHTAIKKAADHFGGLLDSGALDDDKDGPAVEALRHALMALEADHG